MLDQLKKTYLQHNPDTDTTQLDLAYDYAQQAHTGQTRLSGEPYLNHALRTAQTLAEWGLDLPTVTAGLLHDVPEDTERTIDDIYNEFGKEIAKLVEGITKLGKIKYRGYHRYAENLRKMFVAMAEDARAVFIKFADRLDNLRTLSVLPLVKQQRIAKESIKIYAPIAHRLGMGHIRGEMEDLAFPFAFPVSYSWLEKIATYKVEQQRHLADKYIKAANKFLLENGLRDFKLDGRVKRKYSLYRKLLKPKYNKDIDQIYDLVALRIIVPRIKDCYLALGLVNNHWPPMPNRIKDYVAQPKPNGYQSIHTTVFSNGQLPIEFQIRTTEMHDFAEYGLAAHWHYKDSANSRRQIQDKKRWLEQLAKWQKELEEDKEMVKNLRLDAFEDRIFVFTPKGDVIDLPDGATPIDFAYHIHSDIGDRIGGARVNSKMSALDKPLKNSDVVEVIVNKKRAGPSADWLHLVKTQTAKDKIKSALKRQHSSLLGRLLNRS